MTEHKPRKTVLLMDAYSTIGMFLCIQLIDAGFNVRAVVPSFDCADEVHDAAFDYVENKAAIGDQLSFVELDLGISQSWAYAIAGIDIIVHTASSFPQVQSDLEEQLILPAIDSTLGATNAVCHFT